MADQGKLKSPVWEFFEASETSATCKVCKKIIKRCKGSTSNLIAHLQREHRSEHQIMKENEQRKKAEGEQEQQVRTTNHISYRLLHGLVFALGLTCEKETVQ